MKQAPMHPLKSLQFVHRIMLLMQLVFMGILITLQVTGNTQTPAQQLNVTLQVVAIALSVLSYFTGTRRFQKSIAQIKESSLPAATKFAQYRSASILLWAILEGPTLFCMVSFFVTSNYAFIGLATVLLFFFFIFGPNKQKLFIFLGLTEEEIDGL